MALKLEDLLTKKKEPNQILDLSKVKIKTQDEFEKYFDKIPEFKIRPEKIRPEDARVRDNDVSFKPTRKEARKKDFPYGDPCPQSMRGVRMEDLAGVDISWRMLTNLRPKNRLEEDVFSRLVELGKLRLTTKESEAKQLAASLASSTSVGRGNGGPATQAQALMEAMGFSVIKTKRGAVETRIKICKECGLELCTGLYCKDFPYDSYTRMIIEDDEDGKGTAAGGSGAKKTIRRGSNKGKSNGAAKGRGSKSFKGGKSKAGGAESTTPQGGLTNRLKKKKKKRKKRASSKKKGTGGESTSLPGSDEEE